MSVRARIIGTGSCVPDTILTNKEIEKMVETSDEWIVSRTGIRERRIAAETEASSDLALTASRRAMDMAHVSPRDLDVIVVATFTPDMIIPTTACLLQKKLGARTVGAFDISAACSGFIYALAVVDGLFQSRSAKTALVVGVEVLSRVTNYGDRNTCPLFGDGAGAVVLSASPGDEGVLSTHLYSSGEGWELLNLPGGGSRHPASPETVKNKMHCLRMEGKEVFRIAVRGMEEACTAALKANGMSAPDVSLFIPHQANLRIIQATAERLSLPMEKVWINIDRYGNTSSASIPLGLDEVVMQKKVSPRDILLLAAFGGGFTWASSLIRW